MDELVAAVKGCGAVRRQQRSADITSSNVHQATVISVPQLTTRVVRDRYAAQVRRVAQPFPPSSRRSLPSQRFATQCRLFFEGSLQSSCRPDWLFQDVSMLRCACWGRSRRTRPRRMRPSLQQLCCAVVRHLCARKRKVRLGQLACMQPQHHSFSWHGTDITDQL